MVTVSPMIQWKIYFYSTASGNTVLFHPHHVDTTPPRGVPNLSNTTAPSDRVNSNK